MVSFRGEDSTAAECQRLGAQVRLPDLMDRILRHRLPGRAKRLRQLVLMLMSLGATRTPTPAISTMAASMDMAALVTGVTEGADPVGGHIATFMDTFTEMAVASPAGIIKIPVKLVLGCPASSVAMTCWRPRYYVGEARKSDGACTHGIKRAVTCHARNAPLPEPTHVTRGRFFNEAHPRH